MSSNKAATKNKKPKREKVKIHYSDLDVNREIQRYVDLGYEVIHQKTRKTDCIHVIGEKMDLYLYKTDRITSYEEMNLQNKCKKEFTKNIDKIKPINPNELKYNSFSPSLKEVYSDSGSIYEYENICEVDLTKAYYYAALNLGYISKEFFDECLTLPKQHRLRLIGSIATRKTIFSYSPKNEIPHQPFDVKVKQNEKLREAWDNIVYYVDSAMNEAQNYLGEDFLFYWVDGIYFKDYGLNTKKVQLIFEKYGFDSTYEKLHRVEAVNKNGLIELDVYKGENGEVYKPFTVPMYNNKAYNFK